VESIDFLDRVGHAPGRLGPEVPNNDVWECNVGYRTKGCIVLGDGGNPLTGQFPKLVGFPALETDGI